MQCDAVYPCLSTLLTACCPSHSCTWVFPRTAKQFRCTITANAAIAVTCVCVVAGWAPVSALGQLPAIWVAVQLKWWFGRAAAAERVIQL